MNDNNMIYNTYPKNYYPVQVIEVNGRQGAEMYNLPPNSSIFLLDKSGKIIWLVTTDGAGYKSAFPYDIQPHVEPPSQEMVQLEKRMAKMEELLYGIAGNLTANTSKSTGTNTVPTPTSTNSVESTTSAEADLQSTISKLLNN